MIWPAQQFWRPTLAYGRGVSSEATSRTSSPGAGAKPAVVLGYCVGMSAIVVGWLMSDRWVGLAGSLVALVAVFVISLVLGRRLPWLGFVAPLLVGGVWLVVILVSDLGDEGRAWALVLTGLATVVSEAGVLLGAMAAVWAWTRPR